LVEATRQEISGECQRARQELLGNLDSLVVAAAERVLGTSVDAARHRRLIDEAVANVTGAGAATGGGVV
jgi:F0F1-type ATP synthase membrane subunit b/b'